MSRTLQLTLIAILLALAPLVILYEDNFLHDISSTVSFVVFALSVGYLVYSTKVMRSQDTETSTAGLPGVIGFFSVAVLVCSIAAVIASLNGSHGLSLVLSLVSAGVFIGAQFAGGFTSRHLDEIEVVRSQRSAHGRWGDRLALLASRCGEPSGTQALRQLQEKARFLARDSAEPPSENGQIDSLMQDLEAAVASSDTIAVNRCCQTMAQLFDSREISLKRQRSKV